MEGVIWSLCLWEWFVSGLSVFMKNVVDGVNLGWVGLWNLYDGLCAEDLEIYMQHLCGCYNGHQHPIDKCQSRHETMKGQIQLHYFWNVGLHWMVKSIRWAL